MDPIDIVPIESSQQVAMRQAGRRVFLQMGSTPLQYFVEAEAVKATRKSNGPRRAPVPSESLLTLTPLARSYKPGTFARRIGVVAEYVAQYLAAGPATRGELEAVLAGEMSGHADERWRYTAPPTNARTDVSALIHVHGFLAVVPPAVPLPPPPAPPVATMLPRESTK